MVSPLVSPSQSQVVSPPPSPTMARAVMLFFQRHPILISTTVGIIFACVLIPKGAAAYVIHRAIMGIAMGILVSTTLAREAYRQDRAVFVPAMLEGNLGLVRELLGRGVVASNDDILKLLGSGPLKGDKLRILELVLKMSGNKQISLSIPFRKGDIDSVSVLLTCGASNPNQIIGDTTPLIKAIKEYPQLVQILLKEGAQANLSDLSGKFPLQHAVANGSVEICKQLLGQKKGLALKAAWQYLLNLYVGAEPPEKDDLAIAFMEAGAPLKVQIDGRKPLTIFLSLEKEREALVQKAFEKGAVLDMDDHAIMMKFKGDSPCLFHCFEYHRRRVIKGDPRSPFHEVLTRFKGIHGGELEEEIGANDKGTMNREDRSPISPTPIEDFGIFVVKSLLAFQEMGLYLPVIEKMDSNQPFSNNPASQFLFSMTGLVSNWSTANDFLPERRFRVFHDRFLAAFNAVKEGDQNYDEFFRGVFDVNATTLEARYKKLNEWIQLKGLVIS